MVSISKKPMKSYTKLASIELFTSTAAVRRSLCRGLRLGVNWNAYLPLNPPKFVYLYGCFQKWWYPTTMGFPTKNDHFVVFWGYHYFWKHLYWLSQQQQWECNKASGRLQQKDVHENFRPSQYLSTFFVYTGVSKNGGTKEPLVFLLKMIILWCFGGTSIFGNTYIDFHSNNSENAIKQVADSNRKMFMKILDHLNISLPSLYIRGFPRMVVPKNHRFSY